MDQDVDPPPFRADLVEHRFELPRNGDGHSACDRGLQDALKRLDMTSRLLVSPGNGELRADGAKDFRASVSNGIVVGYADTAGASLIRRFAPPGSRPGGRRGVADSAPSLTAGARADKCAGRSKIRRIVGTGARVWLERSFLKQGR